MIIFPPELATISGIKNMIKNILTNLVVIFLSIIFVFSIAEISLRAYHYYKFRISIFNDANHGLFTKDDRLGWKMSSNLSYKTKEKDALNNKYDIQVETNKYGFRLYGNPQSDKVKLFFIGDSFTAAMNVSNDKTYYGIIKSKINDVEVFGYGSGGYGSLQEFMILDEFIDLIKPNIIIWQFHENDFLDNNYEMDLIKFIYNTGTPRPYLNLDGKITHRYAKYDNHFYTLPVFISNNIRLLKYFNTRLSFWINRLVKNKSGFEEIAHLGDAHEGFRQSIKITRMIMAMAKRRAGTIPMYLFCITDRKPYYDTIKNICQSADIHFIDGVPQNLAKYEKENPYSTKASDKEHLDEKGNLAVSERLIQFLRENGIIK